MSTGGRSAADPAKEPPAGWSRLRPDAGRAPAGHSSFRATGWPAGPEQARWGILTAVAALFCAQLFALVWAGGAIGVLYGDGDIPEAAERPIWTLLLFNLGLWVAYLAGPLLIRRVTESGWVPDFDLRSDAAQTGSAVVIGIGAQLAVLPALYWVLLQFVSGDPGRSAEELLDRVDGPVDVILLVAAVVIVAPVVEEWFYRGLLLPTLARRMGAPVAAVVSSAVFALVHQEPIVLPGLFVLALMLSWLTVRTGRIGPAIIAHMAFNATTVVQLLAF